MALELKQTIGMHQQLVITPQLQQAIKLLQLSRLELVETVQQELLENPVLEESPDLDVQADAPPSAEERISDEIAKREEERDVIPESAKDGDGEAKGPGDLDWENYIGSSYSPSSSTRSMGGDELPSYENTLTKRESLDDHLLWQLRLSALSQVEEEIGIEIIGNLNGDGYLKTELAEIAEKGGWSISEVEAMLKKVQAMDPIGVGARSLEECLLLQIQFYPNDTDRLQLTDLIRHHMKLLERKDYNSIARAMKLTPKRVFHLAKLVSELEPRPGRPYGGETTQYITPDVYVYKVAGEYVVMLNEEGLPRLQVGHFYRNLLADAKNPVSKNEQTRDYVQDKLRSAVWLIKSIHQRQRTLYKVTKCIVKFQKEFLDKGVLHLKPMILKNVADEIGVHESTVSRATSNKYVHTLQGIFELKYFFNSGVPAEDGGDSVAAETVKSELKTIIAGEDIKHPYSDQDIVEILKKANINIARRTVAKYREMLGIFPSSRRKQLF